MLVGAVTASHGQTLRFGTADGYVVAHVSDKLNTKAILLDRDYYWVRAQTMVVTQGGIGGTPLHGMFQGFHPDGQLREQGQFERGLKDGEWRSWNLSGRLDKYEHWKNGRLHGTVQRYTAGGALLIEERYRKGALKKIRERTPRKSGGHGTWGRQAKKTDSIQQADSLAVRQGNGGPKKGTSKSDDRMRKKESRGASGAGTKPAKPKAKNKEERPPKAPRKKKEP